MIEKFNFYDVYGYFLPGFTLIAMIWMPFGLIEHLWPSLAIGSAVAVIVFAYIVGHLIQAIAHYALPSMTKDSSGFLRYPSEIFMDRQDDTFSQDFKDKLSQFVDRTFGLDLAPGKTLSSEDKTERVAVGQRRQDAFFLCRGVLIREQIAGYAEQFEGMYTLMRGLTAALALGFAFVMGWSCSPLKGNCFRIVAISAVVGGLTIMILIAAAVLAIRFRSTTQLWVERVTLAALMFALLGTGYILAEPRVHSLRQIGQLALISLLALLFSLRCFAAYRRFSREFAKAVWRDFGGHCMYPSHEQGN